jgi:streptogramin lyase
VKLGNRSFANWAYRWSEHWTGSSAKRQRLPKRPLLESLESRRLLSVTVTEYSALSSGTNGNPDQVAVGPDRNIWFTEPTTNDVGTFSPTTDRVTNETFTGATNGDPTAITATTGANAAVWYALSAGAEIGEIVPGSPAQNIFESPYNSAAGITTLDGNVWFTVPGANQIDVYNPASTTQMIVNYSLSPAANIDVTGFRSQITAGPDGNLWFTEPGAIGIFSPVSNTVIGQVSLPSTGGTQMPAEIAAGPGGSNSIWFTESVPGTGAAAVGVISTTTDQLVTEITAPSGSNPQGITTGPDGNMWFTESGTGAIGMINVNSLTEPTQDTFGGAFAIPTEGQTGGVLSNPDPQGIVLGTGNNLWFADSSGAIGQIALTTTPIRFMVTTGPSSPVIAGAAIGLTVAVGTSASDVDTAFDGSVTATLYNSADVSQGTQTVTAVNGVAAFAAFTEGTAGSGYTISVTSSTSGAPPAFTSNPFIVVPAAPTQVIVTSAPPTTINAGEPFGLTVKLEDQFGNLATNFSGAVTASLASIPPGGSTLGGNTSVIVSPTDGNPGFATFTGLSLNNAGNPYTLRIATGSAATTTAGIDVEGSLPPPPPPPPSPTITGETAVFTQKVNPKTHKKVGKPVFAGYMITFSTAMNTSTLGNSSNYVIDTVVPVKKTKHKPATVKLTPVRFSVTSTTSNTVTLKPPATAFSTKAGQIEVTVGVESAAGAFPAATEMLTIAKGGKRITLA